MTAIDIDISAFATFHIETSGRESNLRTRKSQALLSYLASNPDQAHDRSVLASMFWPELSQAGASNNLSKAVGQIRTLFDGFVTTSGLLKASRHTIELISSPAWRLDARQFAELIDRSRQTPDRAATGLLEAAVALYRGEFMSGFSLPDAPAFESWLLLHRENLVLMARDTHQKLAAHYLNQGEFDKARTHARRQLELDPWHEEAHRQLMRALMGLGLRAEALAQYELCRTVLQEELGLKPETATQALSEQIRTGGRETEAVTPQTVEKMPLASLPRRLLPLVGREQEMASLLEDIAEPSARLITIVGAGGVGKTSLALEAAGEAASSFDDGAIFVSLEQVQARAGTDISEQLAAAIGSVAGLEFSGSLPVHQQLYRQMGNRHVLLVLDNLEHLMAVQPQESAPVVAFLTGLLEHAPHLTLIVTSRERLSIPAEVVFSLEGLPVPPPGTDLVALSSYSSVRLFVRQARRNRRSFRLSDDEGPAVGDICRLVDGLPLGIELAALWVAHFDCSEIAAAIEGNLRFLAAGSPQTSRRHQSMFATFSYSWDMLTPDEQQMLAQLALMPGEFSREAALTISQGNLGDLVRLQAKSLLQPDRPGVYRLRQHLRPFVREKLAERPSDEREALERRFADYYLRRLAAQGEGFNEAWTGQAMEAIGHDIESIRVAWDTAVERGYDDLLVEALQPLYHYYRIQGLFHEVRQLFKVATVRFATAYEQSSSERTYLALLARAQLRQGRLAWLMADADEALSLMYTALENLRAAESERDLSRAHVYLGEAELRLGHLEQAELLLSKALTRCRSEVDATGIATTLELRAVAASLNSDFALADSLFEESIALSREKGNRRLEGRGLHDWGQILLRQARHEQAADCLNKSLHIAKELGLGMPVAFNESMLARIDRQAGHHELARARLVASLETLDGSGYALYTVQALNALGDVQTSLSQTAAARRTLLKSLDMLRAMQRDALDFDYLSFDFLVAAARQLAASERTGEAAELLHYVLSASAGIEQDLANRAAALLAELDSGAGEDAPELAVPLSMVLERVHL